MRPITAATTATYGLLAATATMGLLLPRSLTVRTALASEGASEMRLHGIIWDFREAHADFAEADPDANGLFAGCVAPILGSNGRPAFTAAGTQVLTPARDVANHAIAAHLFAHANTIGFGHDTLGPNLVAHWRFDERTGTSAADSAFGAHGGACQNGAAWNGGRIQTAASFDGADDFIRVDHDDAFLLDAGTLSLWFNAGTLPGGTMGLVTKDSAGYDDGGHFGLVIEGGLLRAQLESTSAAHTVTSSAIAASEWHRATVSFGAAGLKLYVDGALVETDPYTGGLGATSGGAGNHQPIAFGVDTAASDDLTTDGWSNPFHGRLDDVMLFDRQLDDAEVAALTAPCLVVNDTAATTGASANAGITSSASFDEWYTDTPGVNLSMPSSITLVDPGTGTYTWGAYPFNPIDDELFGNEGAPANDYFTMMIAAEFVYQPCTEQFFNVATENDAWVFIDDTLVIDMAGVRDGSTQLFQQVQLDRLGLDPGRTHTLRFFYASRQSAERRLKLATNIALSTDRMFPNFTAAFD